MDIIVYLMILVFGMIFIIYGYQAAEGVRKMISTSWRIPMFYVYFSAVLGGFFISINAVNNLIQLIFCGDDKRSTAIEEVQVVEELLRERAQSEEGGERT